MIQTRRSAISSLAVGGAGSLITGKMALAGKSAAAAQQSPASSVVRPYKINIDARDLKHRLDAWRSPEMPFDTGSSAGVSIRLLREAVDYWRNDYNWGDEQRALNKLPHYRATLEGEGLHFVHWRAPGGKPALPVLAIHGWPSSFVEYVEAATLLSNGVNGGAQFDVIVPSLPGYTLSDAPKAPGMHLGKIADRLHQLMKTLGYSRYGVIGIDHGNGIGMQMARAHPDEVAGLHIPGPSITPEIPNRPLTPDEDAFAQKWRAFDASGRAYSGVQGQQPQTLAIAQQDSPVGFFAWMLEKWWAWSDHGANLWNTFDKKDVINTAMLYWAPNRILSAARIYHENLQFRARGGPLTGPINVPTWITRNPADPFSMPESMMDRRNFPKLVNFVTQKQGGHFPALEHPRVWAEDASAFFGKL